MPEVLRPASFFRVRNRPTMRKRLPLFPLDAAHTKMNSESQILKRPQIFVLVAIVARSKQVPWSKPQALCSEVPSLKIKCTWRAKNVYRVLLRVSKLRSTASTGRLGSFARFRMASESKASSLRKSNNASFTKSDSARFEKAALDFKAR
jgi:hypothetical protein